MADGSVVIEITGDASDAKKELSSIGKEAEKSTSAAEQALARFNGKANSAAASLAAVYKNQGMDSSSAMTKAWAEVNEKKSAPPEIPPIKPVRQLHPAVKTGMDWPKF